MIKVYQHAYYTKQYKLCQYIKKFFLNLKLTIIYLESMLP